MAGDPLASHASSPRELKERLDAERRGVAFLAFRDGDDRQRIVSLGDVGDRVTVGRHAASDLALVWDAETSRLHATLERVGEHWTVVDEGTSRNGTFLNGERISGRRRLADGDQLRFGATAVAFRLPGDEIGELTAVPQDTAAPLLSEAQRRVLVALCRLTRSSGGYAVPATNRQIADDVNLSVDGVKTHLRALFSKFGLDGVPNNEKRVRLVERALGTGAVAEHEL
jgi:DNA-binding CsgD family transcriptional regulator